MPKTKAHLSSKSRNVISHLKSDKTSESVILKLKRKAKSDIIRKAITKQYNRINHQVQQQLRNFDQAMVEKLAEDVCKAENLGTMWKLFNKHKRNEAYGIEPVSPLICPDRQYTINDEEKLTEFARHMHSVHQTPDNPIFDVKFKQEVDKTIREMNISKSETTSIEPIQGI